jgi:UDP-N-acetylglucosamine:LPS N-acetylglucosamine transferase
LLRHGVAVEAEKARDVRMYVDEFLRNPERLRQMREAARPLGRAHAADEAARDILGLLTPELVGELTGAAR